MRRGKRTGWKPTNITSECRCGTKAQVFEVAKGYMSHCLGCGTLIFFRSPDLLERLRLGGEACPHQLERKSCPGGYTTWCPICRTRTVYRDSGEAKQI